MGGEGGGRRRRPPAPPAPPLPPVRPARPEQPVPPRLEAPHLRCHASFLAALEEYQAEGRHLELPAALLTDPAEFARYVAALRAGVARPGEADRYLRSVGATPEPQEGDYVPETALWWVQDDEYLGRVSLRHQLTEELRREGGHIGYEVRPSARGLGHATAMLTAALPIAASLGIRVAHLDCDVGNRASRRVIEKNDGRLEREERGNFYFLVPIGLGPP
ncbi:MAG: GNAT family N-acetyltransferase [Thermoleophilia bacterium]|nr:GNAT family N-acetyltransferase [Thermoleophilia bacterium]